MRNIKFMTFFSFFSSFRSVCARVRLVLAHFSIHCVATVVQYCQAICKQVDTSASNVIMLILIFASRCVFFCCLRSPRYISSFAVRVRSLSHHSFFRGMWFALDSFQIFRVFLSYSQVGLIILHFTYELFN